MSDKTTLVPADAGEVVSIPSEQFVPCVKWRQSFVDFSHVHTCTLDNDHCLDHPEDGHACPCGWFWHE